MLSVDHKDGVLDAKSMPQSRREKRNDEKIPRKIHSNLFELIAIKYS